MEEWFIAVDCLIIVCINCFIKVFVYIIQVYNQLLIKFNVKCVPRFD